EVKGEYPTPGEIAKAQSLADGTGLATYIRFGNIEAPSYAMPETSHEFWEHLPQWWYDPRRGWRNDGQGPFKWELDIPPSAVRFDPGNPRKQELSRPIWWAECPGCQNFVFTLHGWTGGCPRLADVDDESVDFTLSRHHDTPRLTAAYRAARSARFEHGEHG